MPVKPEVQEILDMINATETPLSQQSVAARRQNMITNAAIVSKVAVASVTDRTFPGPGGDIALRCYTPNGATDEEALLPMLVWFHGGGWVLGDLETADGIARLLADAAKAIVVSVDYRLAPENPYPAAIDDALAAVRWVAGHGDELGGDAERLAVGGESAGATMAAVVCQQLRDSGPTIRAQLLIYPLTDWHLDSASITEYAAGYYNTLEDLLWSRGHYLGNDENLYDDPRVSPLRARDDALVGLPPAMIITAEYDPVRDEAEAYATRLQGVGVETTALRFDGVIHGFFAVPDRLPEAADAVARTATFLQHSCRDLSLPRASTRERS